MGQTHHVTPSHRASRQRVLAAANGPLGATLLDVLADASVSLAGVLVGPARPGSGEPCPFVRAWAQRHGIPAVHVASWRGADAAGALAGIEFDLLLSVAYDLILPPAVLALARRAVNLHRGVAPDFKGCYSTAWALEYGSPEVGVTLHEMTPAVDAGPIFAQRTIAAAPELTVAELTPAVERLAAELLAETIGPLLRGELEARPQTGGRSFGHALPDHHVPGAAVAGLAARVRALHFPPHPPVTVDLGERRFSLVETEPQGVLDELTGGAHHIALSSPAAAFAHAFSLASARLVLPFCGPSALYAAADAGAHDVRLYELDEHLEVVIPSLARALAPGAVVVLPAPFGAPVDARAVALARRLRCILVEDRSAAVLSRLPLAGDMAVVGLHPSLAVPDGALLLSRTPVPVPRWAPVDVALVLSRLEDTVRGLEAGRPPEAGGVRDGVRDDVRPRPMSAWSRRELARTWPLPAARAAADALARELMSVLGPACPLTHWPTGTHAHGFPVLCTDAGGALTRLEGAGAEAFRPWIARTHAGAALANRLLLIRAGRGDRVAGAVEADGRLAA